MAIAIFVAVKPESLAQAKADAPKRSIEFFES
jgi:hypothetical protein